MKNFKKTILFGLASILTLSIFVTSCQQDSLIPGQSSDDLSIEDRGRDPNGTTLGGIPNLTHNGQWFVFSSESRYQTAIGQLTTYANGTGISAAPSVDDVILSGKLGTPTNLGDPLDNFDTHYGHQSLRKKVELEEDQRLAAGEDPGRFQDDLDDRGFLTDVEMSLINEDGVVEIGGDIYIAYSKSTLVKIDDRRPDIVQQIITQGTKVAYLPANIADVEVLNVGDVADCTAEFAAVPGNTDNVNNTATYAFLWNNGNASGVTNLLLQWDFGDNTTESGIDAGTSHTYSNLMPYPATNTFVVSLTATYTDEDGTTCNETTTQVVQIALPSTVTTLDECDGVQSAFFLLSPIPLNDINPYIRVNVTPGNEQEVCLNTTGLVNLGSSFLDLTWEWTFQTQTSSDVSPCFDTPCDGPYTVTLELLKSDGTLCGIYTNTYKHGVDLDCRGKDDDKQKKDFEFTSGGDTYKACVVGKHKTKDDNWIFGQNKIKAKMKTYKEKSGGGWKKEKMDHEIHIEGNVYAHDNGCACGGAMEYVDEEEIDDDTKRSSIDEEVYENAKGIYCRDSDPYMIRFVVDDGVFEESLRFPE